MLMYYVKVRQCWCNQNLSAPLENEPAGIPPAFVHLPPVVVLDRCSVGSPELLSGRVAVWRGTWRSVAREPVWHLCRRPLERDWPPPPPRALGAARPARRRRHPGSGRAPAGRCCRPDVPRAGAAPSPEVGPDWPARPGPDDRPTTALGTRQAGSPERPGSDAVIRPICINSSCDSVSSVWSVLDS